jgi:hypothetical protein
VEGKRPLALHYLENCMLVTEDRVTRVLTRTDGAHIGSLRSLCGEPRWRNDIVGW